MSHRQKQDKKMETLRLEKSTAAMEFQLAGLKMQIDREKKMWAEKASENGGNRWRSGNSRASLSKYGKNRRNEAKKHYRHRKKRMHTSSNVSSPGHRKQNSQRFNRQNVRSGVSLFEDGMCITGKPNEHNLHLKPSDILREQDKKSRRPRSHRKREMVPIPSPSQQLDKGPVRTWSIHEVQQWLTSIGLPQYKTLFAENAITGEVLLEVKKDDLDYLNIKALGHRKKLLSGISSLHSSFDSHTETSRRNDYNDSHYESKLSNHQYDQSNQFIPGIAENPDMKSKKIHWTDATLAAQKRAEQLPKSAEQRTNLADGYYDEARESRRFAQAVQEWRNGGNTEIKSYSKNTKNTKNTLDNSGIRDISNATEWKNPFQEQINNRNNDQSNVNTTGRFFQGELDEEAEHEKFARAVEEWRNNGKTMSNSPEEKFSRVDSGTTSHKKISCWQCYKLFIPGSSTGFANAKDSAKFCCVQCANVARDVAEDSKLAADKLRKSEEKNAELARTNAEDFDVLSSNTDEEMNQLPLDYDIWNTEIKY